MNYAYACSRRSLSFRFNVVCDNYGKYFELCRSSRRIDSVSKQKKIKGKEIERDSRIHALKRGTRANFCRDCLLIFHNPCRNTNSTKEDEERERERERERGEACMPAGNEQFLAGYLHATRCQNAALLAARHRFPLLRPFSFFFFTRGLFIRRS